MKYNSPNSDDDMSDEEYEKICEVIKEKVNNIKLRAEQGDAAAQNKLGIMYSHGIGVKIDDNEAGKWFHLSARQNFFQETTMACAQRELKAVRKEILEDSVMGVNKAAGCLSAIVCTITSYTLLYYIFIT